jgi:hypothetical protein
MPDYLGRPIEMAPFRSLFVVCATLPALLPMMTLVLWTIIEAPEGALVTPSLFLVLLFALVSVTAVGLGPVVRGLILKRTGPMTTNTTKPLHGEQAAVGRITQASIVGMVTCEVPLILGFGLGFVSGSWTYYIPFAALAAFAWVYMFPRPSQVRAWYARQMGFESVPGMPV